MLSLYLDAETWGDGQPPLGVRGNIAPVCIKKTGETSFEVLSHLNDKGEPMVRYQVDIRNYEQGVIHSLYFLPYYKNTVPNDRITEQVQRNISQITAMKAEFYLKMRGGNANTVLFYIIPGTDDCVIFSRKEAWVEGFEPIITNEQDIHAVLRAVHPEYEDRRPENNLRLSTILRLDPNDSLAYMEAQLDFVTATLLAVVESSPELKLAVLEKVAEYANFKDALEQSLLFNVKPQPKCVEEIRELKSLAREIQTDYYRQKLALNEAREAVHV